MFDHGSAWSYSKSILCTPYSQSHGNNRPWIMAPSGARVNITQARDTRRQSGRHLICQGCNCQYRLTYDLFMLFTVVAKR